MNFGIEIDSQGRGRMTWEEKTSNLENVYLSVKIPKGSLFSDPDFGLDLKGIDKITNTTVNTLKQRYEQALEWMIDARKARLITVTTFIPTGTTNRIDVTVDIIEMKGTKMQFTTFVEVGGVNGSFVFS